MSNSPKTKRLMLPFQGSPPTYTSEKGNFIRWLHRLDLPTEIRITSKEKTLLVEFEYPHHMEESTKEIEFDNFNVVIGSRSRRILSIKVFGDFTQETSAQPKTAQRLAEYEKILKQHAEKLIGSDLKVRDGLMFLSAQAALEKLRESQLILPS